MFDRRTFFGWLLKAGAALGVLGLTVPHEDQPEAKTPAPDIDPPVFCNGSQVVLVDWHFEADGGEIKQYERTQVFEVWEGQVKLIKSDEVFHSVVGRCDPEYKPAETAKQPTSDWSWLDKASETVS